MAMCNICRLAFFFSLSLASTVFYYFFFFSCSQCARDMLDDVMMMMRLTPRPMVCVHVIVHYVASARGRSIDRWIGLCLAPYLFCWNLKACGILKVSYQVVNGWLAYVLRLNLIDSNVFMFVLFVFDNRPKWLKPFCRYRLSTNYCLGWMELEWSVCVLKCRGTFLFVCCNAKRKFLKQWFNFFFSFVLFGRSVLKTSLFSGHSKEKHCRNCIEC